MITIKESLYEVVISLIVFSLLLLVINIYRGSMETISMSGELVSEFKKVEINKLIKNSKEGAVNGGDVIGVIRFYKDDPTAIEIDGQVINKELFINNTSSEISLLGYRSELEFYETKFDISVDENGNIKYSKIIN